MALTTSTFCTLIILSSFASLVLSAPTIETILVPSGGPESFAFDKVGSLYTGVNDGRVFRYYLASSGSWSAFAYASPTRTPEICDGTSDVALGSICGRTLGLGLHQESQTFYLADAYHGLCAVGADGGFATQVIAPNDVQGKPLKWLDGLDVDQNTGYVYVTDVSTEYNFSQVMEHLETGDSTGILIEYNPYTRKSRILLTGLRGPGGAGCSLDSSYVLFSETAGNKINKYWLSGPKNGTYELILEIGAPANIKLTPEGDFWVGVNVGGVTTGVRIDGNGNILEQVSFYEPYNGLAAQEVQLHDGKLFISSFLASYIGVYDPSSHLVLPSSAM